MDIAEAAIIIDGNNYLVSTYKRKLNIDFIADFLINKTYWASTRTIDQIKTTIEHSICFAVYFHDNQIAFARVISDCATFAYLADVFVIDKFRGKGIAKELMHFILKHPQLQNLRRFILATRDSHGLYAKFGFKELYWTERWMEIYNPDSNDPNQ